MIKEVQGLRCWAILMVIFVHSPIIWSKEYKGLKDTIWSMFQTSTGVELFFVLSGYFFVLGLERLELSKKDLGERLQLFSGFLVKKFKRLAPSAYFWVFIALVFSVIAQNPSLFLKPEIMAQKFFATILWVRNFNEALDPTHLGYFWAISLEIQFFLGFGLCYVLLGKRNTLIISALLVIVMMFYRPGGKLYWVFRFDSIILGIFVYYFVNLIKMGELRNILDGRFKWAISFFFVLTLAATLPALHQFPNFKFTVAGLLSAVMVVLALSNHGYFYAKTHFMQVFIDYIASRSYALFCCHILVWCVVKQVYLWMGWSQGTFFWSALLVMFLAAEFSYRYIENIWLKK